MGFRKEAIVNVYLPFDWAHPNNKKIVLRDLFHAIPEITATSLGTLPPALAGVAIGISCLGLLGLVIFTANQRTKEIGVRKVLGASVVQLISLLSKDFIRLVGLSFIIVVPIAWWAAHRWLRNFAYPTNLSWWIFAISGIFMLVMALLILCLRAGKAALANPVNSLRTE